VKKKILVIDDEARITRMIRRNLEISGDYEVETENDSTQAVATALQFEPDLAIVDVMMPGMDGGEVMTAFSESQRLHHVPVIFLTAIVTNEETGGEGKEIGGRFFLAKPVRTEDLIAAIEGAFTSHA
jgi:DNA-binding response OmpR family regulator